MPYNDLVSREGGAAELPHGMAQEVITDVMRESTVLKLARTIRTDTRDSRIPVLTSKIDSYWVTGDAGMKQTSKFAFEHQAVIAEELAVVVPIPDSIVSDSRIPLWEQAKPQIVAAFGRRLDDAVLFGIDRPASWTSPALVTDALATGNIVASTDDPAADLLRAAEMVSIGGYVPKTAAVRPGWQHAAAAQRTAELVANPVGSDQTYSLSVGGLMISTDPIAWDRTAAEAIVADWTCVVIGIREDVKIELFNTGVISDGAGNIVHNLLMQDTSALRATFRVGALLAKPATDYGTDGSPVALVTPASASS